MTPADHRSEALRAQRGELAVYAVTSAEAMRGGVIAVTERAVILAVGGIPVAVALADVERLDVEGALGETAARSLRAMRRVYAQRAEGGTR